MVPQFRRIRCSGDLDEDVHITLSKLLSPGHGPEERGTLHGGPSKPVREIGEKAFLQLALSFEERPEGRHQGAGRNRGPEVAPPGDLPSHNPQTLKLSESTLDMREG